MFEMSTLSLILFGSLAFLIASFFIGDHHLDTGGDIGHGGADSGGDTHQGISTSELFSPRSLALLAAGFSAASIIARNAGYGDIGTNIAGLFGAVIMVGFGIWLFRVIRRQESNSTTSVTDLVGKTAVVTTSIPEGGFGEITLQNARGTSTSMSAKSQNRISAGASVRITAVSGNIATVNPAV